MSGPPRDVANATGQVYDAAARHYLRAFEVDAVDAAWLAQFEEVLPEGATIIDVGSGPGQLGERLRAAERQIVAVDLSFEMLRVGREQGAISMAVVADMKRLALATRCCDALLVAYSFLHVPRDQAGAVLREFSRVLQPGGLLCIMAKEGADAGWIPASLVPGAQCFVQLWPRHELVTALEEHGFMVLDVQDHAPLVPEEVQAVRLMVLARKRRQ